MLFEELIDMAVLIFCKKNNTKARVAKPITINNSKTVNPPLFFIDLLKIGKSFASQKIFHRASPRKNKSELLFFTRFLRW